MSKSWRIKARVNRVEDRAEQNSKQRDAGGATVQWARNVTVLLYIFPSQLYHRSSVRAISRNDLILRPSVERCRVLEE